MNAIVEAVAVDEGKVSGSNVDGIADVGRAYFEQALVSLASARRENPGCECVCVSNVEMPADLAAIAEASDVALETVPFDGFCPSERIPWQLAYYKLRALDWAASCGRYSHACLMDTDTWCQAPLDELLECSGGASWSTSIAGSPMRTAA